MFLCCVVGEIGKAERPLSLTFSRCLDHVFVATYGDGRIGTNMGHTIFLLLSSQPTTRTRTRVFLLMTFLTHLWILFLVNRSWCPFSFFFFLQFSFNRFKIRWWTEHHEQRYQCARNCGWFGGRDRRTSTGAWLFDCHW